MIKYCVVQGLEVVAPYKLRLSAKRIAKCQQVPCNIFKYDDILKLCKFVLKLTCNITDTQSQASCDGVLLLGPTLTTRYHILACLFIYTGCYLHINELYLHVSTYSFDISDVSPMNMSPSLILLSSSQHWVHVYLLQGPTSPAEGYTVLSGLKASCVE